MKKLSVAIAVYNEELNIRRCLNSIKDIADEIVVVDGGSTDKTAVIVREFDAKIIETDNPPIFHINKQKALEACSGKWILQLDADEVVNAELKKEILSTIEKSDQEYAGFNIPRRNNFWGNWMKKTGVYPDYVIRLMINGKAMFPAKSVHEQIKIDGKVGYLIHPLLHYSYETMGDYWRKAKAYTSLTAKELQAKNTKKSIGNFLNFFFVYPVKTFFTLFVRNQGFVDGVYGFLFSLFSAWHHPISYWKYITTT
jgi:glycosyltransferase involved in cell wall biosynthesis